MLKTIHAFAAIVSAAALIAPTASQAEAPQSVRVSYADLNLAALKGQQSLERRIAFAAKTVCDLGETSRELKLAHATKLCRTDAIDRVQPAYEAAINAARRGTVTVLDAAALIVTAR
jgi:UrcA family protein